MSVIVVGTRGFGLLVLCFYNVCVGRFCCVFLGLSLLLSPTEVVKLFAPLWRIFFDCGLVWRVGWFVVLRLQ